MLEEEQRQREEEARRRAEEEARQREEEEKRKALEEEARRLEEEARLAEERREEERLQAMRDAAAEEALEEAEGAVDEEIEEEHHEGYLAMFRGVMQNLKSKWCVLHGNTFMFFKKKQDSIHAGFLTKMGGGTSTLGRKNWKRRWMALKGGKLHYYPSQAEKDELGVVDVQNCVDILSEDIPIKKDHAFAIETPKRTYFMYADTEEEREEWLEILGTVKGKTDEELAQMMDNASVNPRNAQGTIDVDDILSVGPAHSDVDGHPSFVVMTAERVYRFVARDPGEMQAWIKFLSPKKREPMAALDGGDTTAVVERGWMLKAGGKGNAFKRRRWFILRGDVISYYKTPADDLPVATIPLNSLCSVLPPDETDAARSGEWTFVVHSRHKTFYLTCKTQADANRWVNAIQDVIDNSPLMEMPMEKLIDELRMASPEEAEQIYATHKLLNFSNVPLKSSLLPLPYGEITSPSGARAYETLEAEAVKVSASLLPAAEGASTRGRYGSPDSPVDLIRNVLQLCFDVPKLRNEVYCQTIVQTTNAANPGSQLNLTHWHLLAAMCCSFLPSRKFVRFLRSHLKRTMELEDEVGEEVVGMAAFCLEALKHNKQRDFPPSTKEIEAIMSGKGLSCKVHCVNGRTVDMPITSSTTCGDVINYVKDELSLTECRNGFGLFETCASVSKYLEEKYTVADVLSKWEKYEAHGINPEGGSWRLTFKLFAFYDPIAPDLSLTEKVCVCLCFVYVGMGCGLVVFTCWHLNTVCSQ